MSSHDDPNGPGGLTRREILAGTAALSASAMVSSQSKSRFWAI
jgi:hypothetical protein